LAYSVVNDFLNVSIIYIKKGFSIINVILLTTIYFNQNLINLKVREPQNLSV